MSYALAIAGDARLDWRALELWLQEETIDEIDNLAGDLTLPYATNPDGESVYSFVRSSRGARHYIALTFRRDDAARKIIVLGISHRRLNLP